MATKIALNGFGRIGRLAVRTLVNNSNLELVAINDLTDAKTLAYLFKHDSVHGLFDGTVEARENKLVINGKEIPILAEKDPSKLPWKNLGVKLVIEATGHFESKAGLAKHLEAGAERVLLTSPSKDEVDATLVLGVNEESFDPDKMKLVAMGSCTTYALAPIAKIIDDAFGIEQGFINTTHAYTNTQTLLDTPAGQLRRSRAAGLNIVPTSTGAAKAIGLVIPKLKGKMDGLAVRVPVPDASLIDLTCLLSKDVTIDELKSTLTKASRTDKLKNIVRISEESLVSTDIIGTNHSSIVDLPSIMVQGRLVKFLAWYDNEWSFARRVAELADYMVRPKDKRQEFWTVFMREMPEARICKA
ncbi:MAG: type I glyceraldehyde-3-phosphate dehydrogenase [Bacteroidota bacterium]